MGGYFKGAAGARAGLLKYQGNVFARENGMLDAGFFLLFQIGGQVEQAGDFLRGEIQESQEVLFREMKHGIQLLYIGTR